MFFKQPDEQAQRIVDTINPLTEKYGVNVAAILLAWIMKHPASIIPVIGTTDKSRITELKKSVNITLDDEDWFIIWTASMGKKVP
jgi:predicted oxidoreductase